MAFIYSLNFVKPESKALMCEYLKSNMVYIIFE